MVKINFPYTPGNGQVLNAFRSHLGTGGIAHRVEMLDEIDDDYAEVGMLAFSMAGCLDAPEQIPNGTVRAPYHPSHNIVTEPGVVHRENA